MKPFKIEVTFEELNTILTSLYLERERNGGRKADTPIIKEIKNAIDAVQDYKTNK